MSGIEHINIGGNDKRVRMMSMEKFFEIFLTTRLNTSRTLLPLTYYKLKLCSSTSYKAPPTFPQPGLPLSRGDENSLLDA